SSEALSFADLYTKFASKATDVDNKWALLHLFNIISQDRKTSVNSQSHLDASVLLPNLTISDNNVRRRIENKGWEDGVVVLGRDPRNRREVAFREYVKLVKEENDVTEEAMVTDVLYACQGVDEGYWVYRAEFRSFSGGRCGNSWAGFLFCFTG
ncbi:gamma-tubulin complex component 3, partial [Trifolium medium]|nr:gamma-tubulin complex component 3 [Trifolium medium]